MIHEMIRRHEGKRLRPYRCPAGKRTIGYGWNMDANPLPSDIASCLRCTGEITEDMAERLLNISIDVATRSCADIFHGFKDFSERRRAALVDMCVNLGPWGLLGFKRMRRAILAGDWNEAANQVNDSEYWTQLGGDPKGTDDGRLERPEEIAEMLRNG